MLDKLLLNLERRCNDDDLEKVIEYYQNDVQPDEIAKLALVLAGSGIVLSMNSNFADIASTGGPSSLSTLLCPLYLSSYGLNVLSLGVPGRPAGGIDVLAQIPGYNTTISSDYLIYSEPSNSYLHILASEEYAPLDLKLFQYRKKVNKINIANLAIASLLSKKIALGVRNVGLDIRVAPFGNFGKNREEAMKNSELFIEVAQKLGINAQCYLSNAILPYQPFIGRGEALLALNLIFDKKSGSWLEEHKEYCQKMSGLLYEKTTNQTICLANEISLLNCFELNLKKQGSSIYKFYDKVHEIANEKRYLIKTKEKGYIYYNLEAIRGLLNKAQELDKCNEDIFPDPAGIILLKKTTEKVEPNDDILSVRCKKEYYSLLKKEIQNLYCIKKNKIQIDYFEEVI
ncbi:hypothetical protein DWW31_02975 [Clostridium sp. AF15-17LB]|nr:hypothetical protein DWW31_02975 [Clostridium sp. AF15-17LB]